MRALALLLIAPALASCYSASGEPPMRTPEANLRLQNLLAGKVAGPPVSCLPRRMANNQMTIDNQTLAFRDGSRIYVNHMSPGCGNLGGGYAMVFRDPTGSLCRGDIAQVVDLTTGAQFGGCVLGDFIPYRPAGG